MLPEGAQVLKELVQSANGRVGIMAASGIKDSNVSQLLKRTGVRELHASLKSVVGSRMRYRNEKVSMGGAKGHEYQRFVVDSEKVRKLLHAASNSHHE
jgi:copper homeostasis protein